MIAAIVAEMLQQVMVIVKNILLRHARDTQALAVIRTLKPKQVILSEEARADLSLGCRVPDLSEVWVRGVAGAKPGGEVFIDFEQRGVGLADWLGCVV